jgi:hypothetical protein
MRVEWELKVISKALPAPMKEIFMAGTNEITSP